MIGGPGNLVLGCDPIFISADFGPGGRPTLPDPLGDIFCFDFGLGCWILGIFGKFAPYPDLEVDVVVEGRSSG